MGLLDFWVPLCLLLISPASLAYPSNTKAQSLTNDASPKVISHMNLVNLGQRYPVFPTTCFPPQSRGRPVLRTDLLSDCYSIINEVMLKQDSLLFQDLVFSYTTFKDESGNRYPSRWHQGQCVINVACMERFQYETLQLFNIVLAANKILKECVKDQRVSQGGTTPVGSPDNTFFVSVQGTQDSDAANKSTISLLSNIDLSRRHVQRSLQRTMSNMESAIGDNDANDSTVILQPRVSMEKRATDSQRSSSLSTGTQNSVREGALNTSTLLLHSTNLSRSIRAPPIYPVTCFDPYSVQLKPAAAQDCEFVINQIILRYPDPMVRQTFGYRTSADIDLSLPQNEKWTFGSCAIFVRNLDKTRTDTFRMVDVAYTAHSIMTDCVSGAKYPMGGTADVGTVASNFYVALGGIPATDATNTSIVQYFSSADRVDDRMSTHGAL